MEQIVKKINEIKERNQNQEHEKALSVETVEDAKNMAEAMQNILKMAEENSDRMEQEKRREAEE